MQKVTHSFVAIAFVVAIAAPMIVGIVQPDLEVSQQEKRTLAQWPHWSERKDLKDYFNSVSKYTADQFGFRENLITTNTKIKWFLGYSPSDQLIRGQNDWLFWKITDPLLSQHQYGKAAVVDGLTKRAEYVRNMELVLAEKGIVYQSIIASNKMTVYKEYLPAKFSLTDVSASYGFYRSQFDKADIERQVLTVDVLAKHKSTHEDSFYFKNDTHWNQLGAYLVFKDSLEKLLIVNPSLAFDAPVKKFISKETRSGDLATYIGLDKELVAMEPHCTFRACSNRKNVTVKLKGVNQSICERNETVVLMIGDSFMTYLMPFYSESVGKLYMVTQNISRHRLLALIDQLKPDVVIEELIERNLPGSIPY